MMDDLAMIAPCCRDAVASPIGAGRCSGQDTLALHAVHRVDALECDGTSRDGDAVVIHDATFDRTTNAMGCGSHTAESRADAGAISVDRNFRFEARGAYRLRNS
jgi:hypothetical protein